MKIDVVVGVPIKMLRECEGHIIKLESVRRDWFRGKLVKAENNMNCELSGVTWTKKNGNVCKMDSLYIAGTQITMIVLPQVLQHTLTLKVIEKGRSGRSRERSYSRSVQEAEADRSHRDSDARHRSSDSRSHSRGESSRHSSGDGGRRHVSASRRPTDYHDPKTCRCFHQDDNP